MKRKRPAPRASKENPPLVLVEWYDAINFEGGWKRYREEKTEVGVVQSTGWLVERTSEFLWLIPHLIPETDTAHAQGRGDMTIPAGCVKSVTLLKKC